MRGTIGGMVVTLVLGFLWTSLHAAAPWDKIPRVTISASEDDPRLELAFEAIHFWNRQLAEIGSPFRFGRVTHTTKKIPTTYLERLSAAVLKQEPRPAPPERLAQMPGDLIIALSDGDFTSFAICFPVEGQPKTVVGIRNHRFYPLNLRNVVRNVIAHELGHALGLGHNNDRTMLMCGRPAPCRPDAFRAEVERFFPLTAEEKTALLQLYPPTWEPTR